MMSDKCQNLKIYAQVLMANGLNYNAIIKTI